MSARGTVEIATELGRAQEALRLREQEGHRLADALSAAQTAAKKLEQNVFTQAGVLLAAQALVALLEDAALDQRERVEAKNDECAALWRELETVAPSQNEPTK